MHAKSSFMFEELLEWVDPRVLDAANFFAEVFFPVFAILACAFGFWLVQTVVTRRVFRIVFSEAKKSRATQFLVGWVSIASHELLGHLAVGATTGAKIQEVEVTGRRGHVVSGVERSLGGFFSLMFMSLAPCFMPPLALIAVAYLLFPNAVITDWSDLGGVASSVLESVSTLAVLSSDLFNVNSLFFLYLLVVASLTAGSSPEDVRVVLSNAVARPPAVLFLFLLLGVVVFAAQAVGASVVNPLLWMLALSFAVVMSGLAVGLLLTFYVKQLRELQWLLGTLVILLFAASYVGLRFELLKEAVFLSFPPYALASSFAFSWLAAELVGPFGKKTKKTRTQMLAITYKKK